MFVQYYQTNTESELTDR